MSWSYTPFVWPFLLSVLGAAWLMRYAWPRRRTYAAPAFLLMAGLAAFWSACTVLQVLAVGLPAKIFWADIRYAAIVTTPVAWLLLALVYTGRRAWVTPQRLALLMAVPLMTLIMVLTNPWHHLMFTSITLTTDGPIPHTAHARGPWYTVHVIYSYSLVLLGIAFILMHRIGAARLYRVQANLMVLGCLCPLLVNAVFIVNPNLGGHIDFTPVGFTLSAVFFAWALFRHNFLELMPVARTLALEHIPDAVFVLDAQRHLVDRNPAARSRWPNATDAQVDQWVPADAFDADEVYTAEVPVAAGGEARYYNMRVVPLKEAEELAGWLIMLHDIDAERRSREMLKRARARAEQASQAKSAFLTHMSHELRTPMNAIMGMGSLLAQGDLNAAQADAVATIRQSGRLLLNSISNILDYARLESGDRTLEPRSCALESLLEEALTPCLSLASEQQNTLHYAIEAGTPQQVYVDDILLIQLLQHLVHNALTFTEEGDVYVRLRAEELAEGYRLYIAVRDTGRGMTAAQRDQLFVAFHAPRATGTTSDGLGLGLAISRLLIAMMHGHIHVESEPGEGTTVFFDVQVGAAENRTVYAGRQSRVLIAPEVPAGPLHVLVAEDNRVNQKVIQRVLERNGYDVTIVPDGQAAVDAWVSEGYPVILMDIEMPIMNGLDATRHIRGSLH